MAGAFRLSRERLVRAGVEEGSGDRDLHEVPRGEPMDRAGRTHVGTRRSKLEEIGADNFFKSNLIL